MNKKIGITAAIFFLFLPALVLAQESPQLPHLFYGTSEIDDTDTPVGTVIIAKVGGVERGRITTTEVGEYGGSAANENKLLVQGNIQEGATIEFYISIVKANETANFDSSEIDELNLAWVFPPVIEINETSIENEPIVVSPDSPVVLNVGGVVINITSGGTTAGTINNVTNLGGGFFVGASPPSGMENVSSAFEISISGNFTVIATIPYDDTGINESTVTVYKFDGSSWVPVPSSDIISIDTVANTITFKVPASSTPYTIFAQPPLPPPTEPTTPARGFVPPPTPNITNVTNVTAPTPTPNITNVTPSAPLPTVTPLPVAPPALPTAIANLITGFVVFVGSPSGMAISGIIFLVVVVVLYRTFFRRPKPWRTDYAYEPKYQKEVLDSLQRQVKKRQKRGL